MAPDEKRALDAALRGVLRSEAGRLPGCDAELAVAYLERRLDRQERQRFEAHIAECAACRALTASLAPELLPGTVEPVPARRVWGWRWAVPAMAGLVIVGSAVYYRRTPSEPPPKIQPAAIRGSADQPQVADQSTATTPLKPPALLQRFGDTLSPATVARVEPRAPVPLPAPSSALPGAEQVQQLRDAGQSAVRQTASQGATQVSAERSARQGIGQEAARQAAPQDAGQAATPQAAPRGAAQVAAGQGARQGAGKEVARQAAPQDAGQAATPQAAPRGAAQVTAEQGVGQGAALVAPEQGAGQPTGREVVQRAARRDAGQAAVQQAASRKEKEERRVNYLSTSTEPARLGGTAVALRASPQLSPLPEGAPVRAIIPHDDVLWAVSDGGRIFRSADRGSTWTKVASPTTADLIGVKWDTQKNLLVIEDKRGNRYEVRP